MTVTVTSTRTRKTMTGVAFGEEVEYKTAGDYSLAGAYLSSDEEGKLVRTVVAVGNSYKSVERRTRRAVSRIRRSPLLKSDERYVMEVITLTEATAPVLRDYFGTHSLYVTGWYTGEGGWEYAYETPYTASRTVIRQMAAQGVTWFEVSKHRGSVRLKGSSPWHSADFKATELLRSMNARKSA